MTTDFQSCFAADANALHSECCCPHTVVDFKLAAGMTGGYTELYRCVGLQRMRGRMAAVRGNASADDCRRNRRCFLILCTPRRTCTRAHTRMHSCRHYMHARARTYMLKHMHTQLYTHNRTQHIHVHTQAQKLSLSLSPSRSCMHAHNMRSQMHTCALSHAHAQQHACRTISHVSARPMARICQPGLYLSPSLSICRFLSLACSISLTLSLSPSICLRLSLSLSLAHALSHTHTRTHTHTHARARAQTCSPLSLPLSAPPLPPLCNTHIHTHTHACTLAHTHIRTHELSHTSAQTHTHTHTHTRIHTNTHANTFTHTYTHTHTQLLGISSGFAAALLTKRAFLIRDNELAAHFASPFIAWHTDSLPSGLASIVRNSYKYDSLTI